jgi:hypothetical protein
MGVRCFATTVILALSVVACAEGPTSFQPPPLNYSDRTPLNFAVERVSITNAYLPPTTPPFVDHTIQPTPEAAAHALLQQRLHAIGGTGQLQAVIFDASVIAIDLDTEEGLSGYLTTEAATRLEGRLKVRVDYLNDAGEVVSSATTTVTRTRAIPEDVGYAARQQIGHELVRALVDDLDSGLLSNFQGSFADILLP